jgi:hypothetical protein
VDSTWRLRRPTTFGSGVNFVELAKQEMPDKPVICATGRSFTFTA